MSNRNSITNDLIATKSYSAAGRENHDKIFRKKNAYEWCEEIYGNRHIIVDDGGFRWGDEITMDTPTNRAEFERRLQHCTTYMYFPIEYTEEITIMNVDAVQKGTIIS